MRSSLLQNMRALLSFSQPTGNTCAEAIEKQRDSRSEFQQEVKDYLLRYPETKHVDIYLNDVNGTFRGKRITVDDLWSAANGCYFPQSVYSMDWEGKVVCRASDSLVMDEPDRLCLPVKGTLRPSAYEPRENAQLLLSMQDAEGVPYAMEPRVILENVLRRFHHHGLYPIIAPEIEFYLIDQQTAETRGQGCFQMAVPSTYTPFIERLEKMAAAQNLSLTGIVSEAEPGQFELNLRHSHQVVEVCENVLALRRLTSIVASEFGYKANFMAKPFSQLAGNGLHFHISLNDIHGNNVFAAAPDELNEMTRLCLAGLLHLMPGSLAIMAPGVNAFRRMRKNLNEPLFSSWGYNKRSAALRIPCSSKENSRIEYRLAGADANPYLVMATILTGMLYGLENIDDDDLDNIIHVAPPLPLFQQHALDAFQESPYLTESLGREFSQQWIHSKLAELTLFESIVTHEESAITF
ncbi:MULTISPECIES: glutamine synthetase family protein [Enterobacteriaceae]|uniref:Glutamine synthetase n=2 Tax=Enterobacterales TaxID=91347 RepID=A0A142I437_PLUGE|nr:MULTISPECIES: glutamine synthetase family protein [Enterobacteriaceae]AMR39402.1 glutamine synthetase [Pluralibacter gergoviae]MCM7206154.1 glutamine synthetase family protein [Enterobacter hormaechei]MCM7233601.1 glutamine synthetase family protein [Enterobacter hormaechei]MCO7418340.1 glutamine synthetase family protein [Enterobacter asburiae]MCQ4217612.1 glutamine synthetase family protein [Enterobacter hormaechei]